MTESPAPDSPAPGDTAAPESSPWLPLRNLGGWVPIRSLADRHRQRIAGHLLELGRDDRYLRFGHAATDAQIERYADSMDFERDEVFGIFSRRLELVAMAHLAYLPDAELPADTAEFGVSVLPRFRGCGLGKRLFQLACLHARNRQRRYLLIHALAENAAMLHIAQSAGAWVEEAEAGSVSSRLHLPDDSWASHVEEAVETGLGEIDFRLKRQARQVQEFVERLQSEVRDLLGDDAPPESEPPAEAPPPVEP